MGFGGLMQWGLGFAWFLCCCEGYKFMVGGKDGWVPNPSEGYNQWAGRNRFQVNDTLFFKYQKGVDSVLEVGKDDYYSCNTENPIMKMEGGESEFKFDRSGPFFFIAGNKTSCDQGQKLIVVVLSPDHFKPRPLPASPPTASAPSPSSRPASPAPSLAPVSSPEASAPAKSPELSPAPAYSPGRPPAPSSSPSSPSPTPSYSPAPSSSPPSPSPAPSYSSPSPTPSYSPAPSSPSSSPSPSPASSYSSPSPTPSYSPAPSSPSSSPSPAPANIGLAPSPELPTSPTSSPPASLSPPLPATPPQNSPVVAENPPAPPPQTRSLATVSTPWVITSSVVITIAMVVGLGN